MAMRRSRIKLAPNLGAKARGPAAAASSAAPFPTPRQMVKVESTESGRPAASSTNTLHTSIKPRTESISEELSSLQVPNDKVTAKSEPADRVTIVVSAPLIATSDTNLGSVVPLEALKGVSQITEIAQKTEEDGGGDADVNKPGPAVRVRSRFPKAKPNLTDTGRGRIRQNSVSQSDDESMQSPPALQRNIVRPRQPSLSEAIPSPLKAQAATTESQNIQTIMSEVSAAEAATPEVVARIPNTNNSLGIDLGSTTTKRNIKTEKDDENRKKPKKLERIEGPVDRSKVTMRDIIHMNPIGNPMKSSLAEKERRRKMRKLSKTGEGGDGDDTQSMVSTATLQEERENPENLDISMDVGIDLLDAPTKPEPDTELSAVPQVRIGVNGEIILNESSLFIDNKDPDQDDKAAAMELVHESDFSLPSFSYGRKTTSRLWSEMETKKFYLALSAVGTDFSLMGSLFPKRTRTELKRKFKREEKTNRYLVDKAIREQQHFDQEFFDNLSKLEIEEPVPKRRRKRNETENDSEEDQENQTEKPTKKKTPAKVKEEKAETTETGKKKRGRKPKEQNAQVTTIETLEKERDEQQEKTVQHKRKAQKKKALTYQETNDRAVGTQPSAAAGSSSQIEGNTDPFDFEAQDHDAQAPHGPMKPKRKRKPKASKEAAASTLKASEVVPTSVAGMVSVAKAVGVDTAALTDLLETNHTDDEVQEASYVFVTSSQQQDPTSGSEEPVIQVYLVSPTRSHEPPTPDPMAEMHHPTPSPMTSPMQSPLHTPEALNSATLAAVAGVNNNNGADVTPPTDRSYEYLISAAGIVEQPKSKGSKDVTSTVPTSVAVSSTTAVVADDTELTQNGIADAATPALATDNDETVYKKTADAKSGENVPEESEQPQEKPVRVQRARTRSMSRGDTTPTTDLADHTPKSPKMTAPQKTTDSTALCGGDTQNDKSQRQSAGESSEPPNNRTTVPIAVETNSSNAMQTNPDKAPAVGGRRRRITAMPKLPAGKRRAGPAVSTRVAPQSSAIPANEDYSEPPIDDITAGGILLEMSSGKALPK